MIVDANEVLKSLIKCCGTECIKGLEVVELNDPNTKKNKTVFLGGGVGKIPLFVPITIRGIPNDRKSTVKIAEELFEFFDSGTHSFEDETGQHYIMQTDIEVGINGNKEFVNNGVDGFKRTTMSTTIIINNLQEER